MVYIESFLNIPARYLMSPLPQKIKIVNIAFQHEEAQIIDMFESKLDGKEKKKANYALNMDKALTKIQKNLERGSIKVENTPKNGAKLVYMNPGEFKEVMDVFVNLKIGQKFTIGNLNVHVTENYEMEERVLRKVQHKLVLRLNRRVFPTSTTNATFHLYPTEQKLMIQGSIKAQSIGEKEFLLPFVKKVLAGKEASIAETNDAVAEADVVSKKRKKPSFPCDYCENSFMSITDHKKHVLTTHIVALETAKLVKNKDNLSPTSSPPTKKEKMACVTCGRQFSGQKYLNDHMKRHLQWAANVRRTPGAKPRLEETEEELMINDTGIEVGSKEFLDEIINAICPESDAQSPANGLEGAREASGQVQAGRVGLEVAREGSSLEISNWVDKKVVKQKRDPNLRALPSSVKAIVEEGSEEYVVRGDGPCLLRTAGAHLFGDENEGPQMARDLNTHLSYGRDYYEEKISADFPLTVTVGVNGEIARFENSNEYFDWLQESRRAAYKWSSCVDIMALSNMTHMDIDILVYEEGKVPEIRSFKYF